MGLVGVADIGPTLAARSLAERDMPFPQLTATPGAETTLEEAGMVVLGGFDDLIGQSRKCSLTISR